jgi:hypothetical protein
MEIDRRRGGRGGDPPPDKSNEQAAHTDRDYAIFGKGALWSRRATDMRIAGVLHPACKALPNVGA